MFKVKKDIKKVCAIVLAAGTGSRMGSEIKKQFIEVNGKPLIYYSLKAISSTGMVDNIILVTASEDLVTMQDIVKNFNLNKVSKIISGGKTRQDSVYNGLMEISKDYDYVLVHDGARPLVNKNDIENVIKDAFLHKAATLGVKVKDTIKVVDKDCIAEKTLDRNELVAIQTPQVIERDIFIKGYENINGKTFTDDTSIVENIGIKVKITLGDYSNVKITTKDDLIYLEGLYEL